MEERDERDVGQAGEQYLGARRRRGRAALPARELHVSGPRGVQRRQPAAQRGRRSGQEGGRVGNRGRQPGRQQGRHAAHGQHRGGRQHSLATSGNKGRGRAGHAR